MRFYWDGERAGRSEEDKSIQHRPTLRHTSNYIHIYGRIIKRSEMRIWDVVNVFTYKERWAFWLAWHDRFLINFSIFLKLQKEMFWQLKYNYYFIHSAISVFGKRQALLIIIFIENNHKMWKKLFNKKKNWQHY